MEWSQLIDRIAFVIVGAGIGFGVDVMMRKRDDRLRKARFAAALVAEVTALLKRHKQTIGDHIKNTPESKPLGITRIPENYFQVFDSMCSNLGLLDSSDAEMVVSFYTDAKGYVETWRFYADLVEQSHRQYGCLSPIGEFLKISKTIRRADEEIKEQAKQLILRMEQIAGKGNKH